MPRPPSLTTLILLTMATTLSLNMFLPALPVMAREFGVSYGVISLSFGGYLGVTAVMALILGPLSDRVGRRPVALGVAAVFTLASMGAAMAQDVTWFLACRFAQGVMVGGFVLASAVVRDTRAGHEVASLLAYITSAMAVAPLLGPLLGGVVTSALGWRAVFWLYAGLGGVLLAVLAIDLRETRPVRDPAAPAHVGAWRTLLREPRFWALIVMLSAAASCFYAFRAATPLVAARAYGWEGTRLGIGLGSITLGFMVASFAAGRLSLRTGPGPLMTAGRLAAVLGLAAGLLTTTVWPAMPLALFAATIFIGIGNGLSIPTGNAIAMSIRPDLAGTATGLIGATTVGVGAFTTTAAAALMACAPRPNAMVGLLLAIALVALVAALIAQRLGRQADAAEPVNLGHRAN